MLRRIVGALLALSLIGFPSAAVAAPAGATPAAALAASGTVLYVKDHNVFVARPDGTGARQLTTSGTAASPWVSPDGTDAGIVVAAKGPVVYRMDQWGTVLNAFDPPDVTDTAGWPIGGNVTHVAISPDGGRVAYTYQHYTCPPQLSCKTRWATSISASDRLTPPSQYGWSPYDNPTWVSNSRLLLNGRGTEGIVVYDIGASTRYWFDDGRGDGYFTGDVTDPALSRSGEVFAAGYQEQVWIYSVNGDVRSGSTLPPSPSPQCYMSSDAAIGSPTVAPDGSAVAWREPDGVWALSRPLDCDTQPSLVLPGASAPAWTGAALQATRPTYPPPAVPTLTVTKRAAATGTARVGKRLTARPATWVTAGRQRPVPVAARRQGDPARHPEGLPADEEGPPAPGQRAGDRDLRRVHGAREHEPSGAGAMNPRALLLPTVLVAALVAGCGGEGGGDAPGKDGSGKDGPGRAAPPAGVPEECVESFPGALTTPALDDVELLPAGFPEPPVDATLCETGGTVDQGQEYASYASDAPVVDVLAGYESALSSYGASLADDGAGRRVVNAQVGAVAVQVQPRDGGFRIVFAR